jgi:hypothetical protein
MVISDLALSRRLERAEGLSNRRFVEARAALDPASGATWTEVAGAYAMFDGARSPLTQTFGLGLFEAVSPGDLDAIETFFGSRGAATHHEVSPLAPTALLASLVRRGYLPIEVTSVMYQTLPRVPSDLPPGAARVRVVEPGEEERWARTAAAGWEDVSGELASFMFNLARVNAATPGAVAFLAELDGTPAASGALWMNDGVAVLAGASTIGPFRGRGAQRALLDYRLSYALQHGCELAMICAAPGSASQRNAEREGFRIAYTRTKWQRGLD